MVHVKIHLIYFRFDYIIFSYVKKSGKWYFREKPNLLELIEHKNAALKDFVCTCTFMINICMSVLTFFVSIIQGNIPIFSFTMALSTYYAEKNRTKKNHFSTQCASGFSDYKATIVYRKINGKRSQIILCH